MSITDGSITKYVDPHLKKPSGPTVSVDEICEEEILRPGIYVSEVGSCKLDSDKMYGCVENLAVWSQMARKVISVAHLWCKLRRKMLFIMIRIPAKLHKIPFSATRTGKKRKNSSEWNKRKRILLTIDLIRGWCIEEMDIWTMHQPSHSPMECDIDQKQSFWYKSLVYIVYKFATTLTMHNKCLVSYLRRRTWREQRATCARCWCGGSRSLTRRSNPGGSLKR